MTAVPFATGTLTGYNRNEQGLANSSRVAGTFADSAALKALPVARRSHGQIAATISPVQAWVFNQDSSAGASASVLVPDAGSGRWLSLQDQDSVVTALLASTDNGEGASLVGIEDAGTIITATTVEGALAENRAAIDVIEATLGSVTVIQVAGGTFASGTATINAGIVVTANTDAFVVMSAVITGSTNVGGIAHLKASNSVGGAGVGAVTLNVLGADGAVDSDAAGAFRVLLIN